MHRINYHLLSAAEARTKREAPVLAFWKRNPLVARCDTYPDAEADATAVQCARDLHCDAANNGRHGETSASRRYETHSCLLETDFVEKFDSKRIAIKRSNTDSRISDLRFFKFTPLE